MNRIQNYPCFLVFRYKFEKLFFFFFSTGNVSDSLPEANNIITNKTTFVLKTLSG